MAQRGLIAKDSNIMNPSRLVWLEPLGRATIQRVRDTGEEG